MKKLFNFLMLFLLVISTVNAETRIQNNYMEIESGIAEPTSTTFAFISGISGNPVDATYHFNKANYYPSYLGSKCKINQYILALQCTSSKGDGCIKVFKNDYLKEDSNDNIYYGKWKYSTWMKDLVKDKPFTSYQCLEADPQKSTGTKKIVDGKFTQVNVPKEALTNDKITIKGSFKVTKTGPMVLEAHINLASRKPLAVLPTTENGACGSNAYYAGYKMYGEAGKTYDFTYIVKSPSKEGEYDVEVYVYTDCSNKGGYEIQSVNKKIKVKSSLLLSPYEKCGTTDKDNDGVFDECDLCPTIFGSEDNWGCHPCYRMDPTTASGLACYKSNEDTYGVPDVVQQYMDPVISVIQQCEDNDIVTYKVHESGIKDVLKKDSCNSNQECVEKEDNAYCKDIQKEIIMVDYELKCLDGNVAQYNLMSDDSEVLAIEKYRDCKGYGCEDGGCLEIPEEEGQDPITTTETDCEISADCEADEYCDSLYQCVPYSDTGCTLDSDCEADEYCSSELDICLTIVDPECTLDSDCEADEYCYQEYCLQELDENGTSPTLEACTQDQVMTCDNGDTIITGVCKSGELFPLTNYCGSDNFLGGSDKGIVGVANYGLTKLEDSMTNKLGFSSTNIKDWKTDDWFIILSVLAILGVATYYSFFNKRNKKGKNRRKRK